MIDSHVCYCLYGGESQNRSTVNREEELLRMSD